MPPPMPHCSPPQAAALLFLASAASLLAVYGLEIIGGFAPCRLCLWQRLPWAAVLLLAAAAWHPARRARAPAAVHAAFLLAALSLTLSAGLGAWHAGIEWGLFPELASCTAQAPLLWQAEDLLRQLETAPAPVSCAQAPFRVAGLSLAGYNALLSLAAAVFALRVARALAPGPRPRRNRSIITP